MSNQIEDDDTPLLKRRKKLIAIDNDDVVSIKRRKPYVEYAPQKKYVAKDRYNKNGQLIAKPKGRPKGTLNKKTVDKQQKIRLKDIKKNISEKEILITPLFSKIKDADNLIVCLRGGARSSKSYSMCQLLTERFFGCPGRRILVLRKTLPSLRVTTLSMMREYLQLIGLWPLVKEFKQTLDWKYGNTLLHFGSLDDPEKIKCFHPDTELLTKDGWKSVTELKQGEIVASVNPQTFETDYYPIKEMHTYDYSGNMVSPISDVREPYTNFCVTPEHKMLVYSKRAIKYKHRESNEKRWRFKEAGTLPLSGKEYSIPIASKWDTGNIIETYRIPRIDWNIIEGGKKNKNGQKKMVFPIVPWLKFLGWYLSEGCGGGTRGKSIHISQTKKAGMKQFIKDMKDFPINYTYANKSFNFNSKDLAAYVKRFGLSNEKYIPRKVLNLHPSLLKYLFDALIAGDGRKESEKRWTYGTASKQLADDVCEIAVKLGYAVAVRKQTPKGQRVNGDKYYDSYIISIKKQEIARLGRTTRIPYKGKVYCPTIAPYHTCIIRYKGKVSISGQSSDWNDIWIEEATEFSYRDFMILKTRLSSPICGNLPNQMFLTFNPEDEYSWIKEKVIDTKEESIIEIASSYKDNPFLSDEYIKILLDLEKQDQNYWRIYGLGEWGRLTNVIYSNWKVVSDLPIQRSNVIYGLDFGFNNPSALLKCYIDGQEVGVEEKLYATGLTTNELITKMEEIIPFDRRQKDIIYADNAEPDRILEINNAGFWCVPCYKVSVTEGINDVKQFQIYSLTSNTNYNKEAKTYSWKQDKNDKILDEAVKYNDHLMDALRYALSTYVRQNIIGRPRIREL